MYMLKARKLAELLEIYFLLLLFITILAIHHTVENLVTAILSFVFLYITTNSIMCSIILAENIGTTDPSESFIHVKQEIDDADEIGDVRNEPMLGECLPNEFYNEESKYIIDQIKDENGQVLPKEDFTTTWNSHYIKTETIVGSVHSVGKIEDFNTNNESKSIIKEMGDQNDEVWTKEDILTSWNDSLPKDVNIDNPFDTAPLDLAKKELDDTILKPFFEDSASDEFQRVPGDIKTIMKQIIEENSKNWWREDLTERNSYSVKMEKSEEANSKIESLQQNSNSSHSESKNHKCELCDYSTPWKSNIQQHMKSAHLKLKNHKCDLCDYSASLKGNLQRHMKSVHLKIKNHKCNLCDYSSSWKSDLQQHMKSIHWKLKNHKCDLCDYSSSREADLRTHNISAHLKLKSHKCDLCDYSSVQKGHVQQHINSVHLKIKNHKCDFCDYSSSWKRNLQLHMKSVHLKLKNHECKLCDYSSSFKSALQRHQKLIHLKLQNHECEMRLELVMEREPTPYEIDPIRTPKTY